MANDRRSQWLGLSEEEHAWIDEVVEILSCWPNMTCVEIALDEASRAGSAMSSRDEPWPNPAFSLALGHLLNRSEPQMRSVIGFMGYTIVSNEELEERKANG